MNKLRVVFYARVSTDRDDQLHSFATQQEYFKNYITQNKDMIFIRGYADEGISGISTKNRIEFLRMIEDARLGKFDLILTKEVSRFARNTVDTLSYTRELSRLNVGVLFTNDGIDTRQKDGELRLTIMASLAQDESRKISERVNWAVQRNYENGVAHGGMPYGYRRNKKKEIVVYEPEANIVRKVFELYLQGLGCRRILQELRKIEGIKEDAEKWNTSKITNIIKNPKYCGDLVQGLSYTTDFLTKSRLLQKDKDKLFYIKDHHEAIISREVFDKAQEERIKRAAVRDIENSKFSNKYIFSNKIECGHCHKTYVRKTSVKNGIRYTVWKCSTKDRRGVSACKDSKNIKEEVIYSIIKNSYDFLYVNSESIIKKFEIIFSKLITKDLDESKRDKLNIEKEKLTKQLDKLIDLNIEGFISGNLFDKKYNDLKSRIEQVEHEILKIDSYDKSEVTYKESIQKLLDLVASKVNDWINLGDELIEKLLYKIEVISKEEFNIYLNCGSKISINSQKKMYFPPNSISME